MTLETFAAWFLVGCILIVAIALLITIIGIALWPILGLLYLIAEKYSPKDKKIKPTSCSKVHFK